MVVTAYRPHSNQLDTGQEQISAYNAEGPLLKTSVKRVPSTSQPETHTSLYSSPCFSAHANLLHALALLVRHPVSFHKLCECNV
jgi:hypothetical protein